MREIETYRGFRIVETDWTTEVRTLDPETMEHVEAIEPVFIIRDLKERPSLPFLTSAAQCRDYIDEELDGRDMVREAESETFRATVRKRGNSLMLIVPARSARILGVGDGDEVEVTVRRP